MTIGIIATLLPNMRNSLPANAVMEKATPTYVYRQPQQEQRPQILRRSSPR
jgi:hypothetical protein